MIEKDNIQELFSKAFENQTSAVRPELWAGVQAKMAAAGVASTATVAAKGLSALTKWIIGSAAVGTVGVVTTVIALNTNEEPTNTKNETRKEISQNTGVTGSEENKTGQLTGKENTYSAKPEKVDSNKPSEDVPEVNAPVKEVVAEDQRANKPEPEKTEQKKPEEKTTLVDNSRGTITDKGDAKKVSEGKKDDKKESADSKLPDNTKEHDFVNLEAKVTKFPTMFTPNGDASNDTYFVKVENIDDFQLLIIDQNNREMFRATNPDEKWNGTTKSGEEAPSGTYAAIVTGKDQNGKSFRDIQLFELRR